MFSRRLRKACVRPLTNAVLNATRVSVATFFHWLIVCSFTLKLETIFALMEFCCSCQVVFFMLSSNVNAFEITSYGRLV